MATEFEQINNSPFEVEINGKKYSTKNASLGAYKLISPKIKRLWELSGFDLSKYDKDSTTMQDIVGDMLSGIYRLLLSDDTPEAVNVACEIIAILINNKPLDAKDIKVTPEDIEFGLSMKELMRLLVKILDCSSLQEVFLMLTRIALANDMGDNLKTTPSNIQK
jgi:hypothetical protein